MATLTIPLVTLPAGVRDFGPVAVADAETGVRLTLDRTVAGGLNATPAAHIDMAIMQSNDGGASWKLISSAGINGGILTGPGGVTLTTFPLVTQWDPGTGRQAKATITVTGASVAVAGTLTSL